MDEERCGDLTRGELSKMEKAQLLEVGSTNNIFVYTYKLNKYIYIHI